METWIHGIQLQSCQYKVQKLFLYNHGLEVQGLTCLQELGVGMDLQEIIFMACVFQVVIVCNVLSVLVVFGVQKKMLKTDCKFMGLSSQKVRRKFQFSG